jgi:hypothetical protein
MDTEGSCSSLHPEIKGYGEFSVTSLLRLDEMTALSKGWGSIDQTRPLSQY